jgi:hypothetical protein
VILKRLRENVRRFHPELWLHKNWLSHNNSTLSNTSFSKKPSMHELKLKCIVFNLKHGVKIRDWKYVKMVFCESFGHLTSTPHVSCLPGKRELPEFYILQLFLLAKSVLK